MRRILTSRRTRTKGSERKEDDDAFDPERGGPGRNRYQTAVAICIIHTAMGHHERSEHVAASSLVDAHGPWRASRTFREQTRFSSLSTQAPHPLRVPVPEGSAYGARTEAQQCGIT